MTKYYHLWVEGCQMNYADVRPVAAALEHLGYQAIDKAEHADVVILETCTVRQSAEDRAYGRLSSLRPVKERHPNMVVAVTGCLVGIKGNIKLQERFPFVDVFMPPATDGGLLVAYLLQSQVKSDEQAEIARQFAIQDGVLMLPMEQRGKLISAPVAVVYGCSHACTFCQIPLKRGGERSRKAGEIAAEVRALVAQGVREVTLLGQIVDRYGKDLPGGPSLAGLLKILDRVEGLERIRFLTSHPNYFSEELMDAVAELPKVMPHIEIPIQAGDDEVLANMKRGYTNDDYRRIVSKIHEKIPGCSIATDIIVGFPGESEAQFMKTYELLANLKMDVAHLARYSPRAGTVSARRMMDDVPAGEKMRRFRRLEELQEGIAAEIAARYLGQTVAVLFEEKVKSRWKGRTATNKLVFVETDDDLRGKVLPVTVTWAGPWSMQAALTPCPSPNLQRTGAGGRGEQR